MTEYVSKKLANSHGAQGDGPQMESLALQRFVKQLHQLHSGELDRVQTFTWSRCLVSLVSYALFFSDVLRSGLGYQGIPDHVSLEPNTHVIFGPAAYTFLHLTSSNATSNVSAPYWPYKYDTTSAAMRAIAEYLSVPEWSPCLLYKEECLEASGIPLSTVFDMIDALVGNLQDHRSTGHGIERRSRGHLTLRIKLAFFDRVHDYIFPSIFQNSFIGTAQAIVYSQSQLERQQYDVCGPYTPRPYACAHQWTRFSRSCDPGTPCAQIGSVWSDIRRRTKALQAAYPNQSIETAILECTNDNRAEGLVFQGRKYADVVVLTRVRSCNNTACNTVAVDDSRYEIVSITSNSRAWYVAIAVLRALGQAYAWIRLATLVAGCYVARTSEAHLQAASILTKILITMRTVFTIPSQIIVYGSTVPIACYAIAHLIDNRFGHEILAAEYISRLGSIYNLELDRYFRANAVAMRCVWILASVCHISLKIHTHRLWTPNQGIPGVPEFLISFVALPTVFAHLRVQTRRDTRLLDIQEVVPSARLAAIRRLNYFSRRNFAGELLFGGCSIDIRCACGGAVVILALSILVNWLRLLLPRHRQYKMVTISRTMTPGTAGSLWHPNAFVVSWDGSIFVKQTRQDQRKRSLLNLRDLASARSQIGSSTRLFIGRSGSGVYKAPHGPSILSDTQRNQVNAVIYLMNLAVMSDPMTLFRLRILSRRDVGVFKSQCTRQYLLLPYPIHEKLPMIWNDLHLVSVVSTKDLSWWVLLQCG